jgi:hypothetical protein
MRKAQGSLEFLMTYSWALVLLGIVILVAWRWGVFSFTETIKPEQYGFWGVEPLDYKMSEDGTMKLSVHNGVGANVTVNSIMVIMGPVNTTISGIGVIEPGGKTNTADITGLERGTKGSRFDVFVVINYSNAKMQSSRERLSSGMIMGAYE